LKFVSSGPKLWGYHHTQRINDRLLILLGWLIALWSGFAGFATTHAAEIVIGVNMTNPQRLSVAEQDAMLAAMKSAGVRVIRADIAPDDKGLDFVRRVSAQGIRMDWILGFGGYRSGAPTRPYEPKKFPGMWSGHPLSDADPDQFRAVYAPMLASLEAHGVVLAAFEAGNEINWAGFNPEFPLPGEGRNFGLADLARDPEAKRIATGYDRYLQILAVLKEIRDGSRLNRRTPILTAGLAAHEGPEGPLPNPAREDAVSVNATLDYLRAHGLDNWVDAYAIHVYPWDNGPGDRNAAAGRRARLARYVLSRCRPAGGTGGKPCWITEWGFANNDMSCPIDDTKRALLVREMMSDFRPYAGQERLAGLFYYSWNTDAWAKVTDPLTIYRCGALTESGRAALDVSLLR
jgi:hypothetical protein